MSKKKYRRKLSEEELRLIREKTLESFGQKKFNGLQYIRRFKKFYIELHSRELLDDKDEL